MTDETLDDELGEVGLEAVDRLQRVRDHVLRADESLTMLAGVQIASTQTARHALDSARLAVLERLLRDVRGTVGLPVPVPAGQMELEA